MTQYLVNIGGDIHVHLPAHDGKHPRLVIHTGAYEISKDLLKRILAHKPNAMWFAGHQPRLQLFDDKEHAIKELRQIIPNGLTSRISGEAYPYRRTSDGLDPQDPATYFHGPLLPPEEDVQFVRGEQLPSHEVIHDPRRRNQKRALG